MIVFSVRHFRFFWLRVTLGQNSTRMKLTLQKHLIKLTYLYIKLFQNIFFYAFYTIMKLFFTTVYVWIISLTLIFEEAPVVEYPFGVVK